MAVDVKEQLLKDLQSCKYFSISLDESNDVTSKAMLAILARFSDGISMREKLVKLVSLTVGTTEQEIVYSFL
jgi:hypothetical protein